MDAKTSSGSAVFDGFLEGGFENDAVTAIYGPAGSGKTTACLLAAIVVASKPKKVVYVDTEGGFSVTRLEQLTGSDKKLMGNILFLRPTNFEEQKKCISQLNAMVNSKIGMVIVDTITNLYRTERTSDNVELNRELGRQVAQLVEIVRTRNIPVIITTQVYEDIGSKSTKLIGGDIINYNSKCMIELKSLHSNKRAALLHRHRHLPQKEILFEIRHEGFSELKDKFRIF